MKHEGLPEATLVVGGWRSHCNACGNDASPSETSHITRLGYTEAERGDGKGCGVEYTHVYPEYGPESGRGFNPDLPRIMPQATAEYLKSLGDDVWARHGKGYVNVV